ncbi:MAG: hypothetical protein LBF16_10150, partial [Pseudomonadales bacterium]|nr:hypothetical protein [Pseudomonadales bacterium]
MTTPDINKPLAAADILATTMSTSLIPADTSLTTPTPLSNSVLGNVVGTVGSLLSHLGGTPTNSNLLQGEVLQTATNSITVTFGNLINTVGGAIDAALHATAPSITQTVGNLTNTVNALNTALHDTATNITQTVGNLINTA